MKAFWSFFSLVSSILCGIAAVLCFRDGEYVTAVGLLLWMLLNLIWAMSQQPEKRNA